MTCQDVAATVGQRSLFLGVDTINWNIVQFQQAARFAKAHGFDTVFVKVGEGTWTWYGGLAGWQNIRKAIQAEGVGAIGYFYSKGKTLGGLDGEIDLLIQYMQADGVVMADMEVEWNGDVASAQHLCARMKPEKGIFLVSTWGNPYDQAWQGVIQALNPCVNSYLPQQYTNYLASCWQQYGAMGAACIMPTVMMTGDFGPNDPVAITRAAHQQGHAAMSVWYYDTAINNPGLLDQIVAAFPGTTAPPKPPQGGTAVTIPNGWKDNGSILTAPNGIPVTQGFRDYVLSHNWDANNIPLEEAHGLNPLELSNTALGAGTRQSFRWIVLEWTSKAGVFESYAGQELVATLNILHKTQNDLATLRTAWDKVVPEKNALIGQVSQLTAQLKQSQDELATLKAQQPPANVEQLQQQVDALNVQNAQLTAKIASATDALKQVLAIANAQIGKVA